MFHVNAWGLPYRCPLVGAGMVMPGARLDGASLYEQFEREGVTFSAGVPTIWLGLLNYLKETGKRLTTLERVVIGGAAAPRAMIDAFEDEHGVAGPAGLGHDRDEPGRHDLLAQRRIKALPPGSAAGSRTSRAARCGASR